MSAAVQAAPPGSLWSMKGPYGPALRMLNLVNCGRPDAGLTFAHHFCLTPRAVAEARASGVFPAPDVGLEKSGIVHGPCHRCRGPYLRPTRVAAHHAGRQQPWPGNQATRGVEASCQVTEVQTEIGEYFAPTTALAVPWP